MIIVISILFTTFLVLAIKIVTHEESVLHWLKLKVEKDLPSIADPLLVCPFCMPTFWSLIGWGFTFLFYYLTTGMIEYKFLLFYPITIAASSFFAGLLWVLLEIFIKINNNN